MKDRLKCKFAPLLCSSHDKECPIEDPVGLDCLACSVIRLSGELHVYVDNCNDYDGFNVKLQK